MPTAADRAFVATFEDGRVPSGGFRHRDHVRLAWIYLRQGSLADALGRMTANLRAFAAAQGKPGLYHATITWAFVFLIHERMGGLDETWERFAARNPDLLCWRPSPLDRYYSPERLASAAARAAFVLPDRPR